MCFMTLHLQMPSLPIFSYHPVGSHFFMTAVPELQYNGLPQIRSIMFEIIIRMGFLCESDAFIMSSIKVHDPLSSIVTTPSSVPAGGGTL